MRTLTYCIGSTIDGYIAAPDLSVDFFAPDEVSLAYVARHLPDTLPTPARPAFGLGPEPTRFDTVLMGRATYEPGMKAGVPDPYAHLRTYVVSRTLADPDHDNISVVAEDPIDLVRRLKSQSGAGIWLAGGGRLAGSVLPEIDELIFKVYPLVAGAGIHVFGDAVFYGSRWVLAGSTPLTNGMVVTTYRRHT